MNRKSFLLTVSVLCAAILFNSCNSVPKEIPEMTAQELIQNGQSNFDSGNYKAALAYYNTAVERYRDWPNIYVEARYEIGHVYMKQKKYDKAEPIFNELKEIYKSTAPGVLPPAYKRLSEIELNRLAELNNK